MISAVRYCEEMSDDLADGSSLANASGTTGSPPPRGNRDDTRSHQLDVVATILLGLAAVLVAWGAYQSSLWGGVQDRLLTESVNATTQATDLFQQADTTRALDQTLFIELFTSGACDHDETAFICEQIYANMSPEGTRAIEQWLENDDVAPFGDTYNNALYANGDDLLLEADNLFASANDANSNGDDYSLAVTLLTVTLFFAGLSVTIDAVRARVVLLITGFGFLAGGTIFMATLPFA